MCLTVESSPTKTGGVSGYSGFQHKLYKEALTRPADGEGRYVRQMGGRGQYGHVKIHVYPGEPGSGYVFENEIVGGAIPKGFIKPIDEGIKEALTHGVIAGHPVDDVKIELYDGSFHDVDSPETTFKLAGSSWFTEAITDPGWIRGLTSIHSDRMRPGKHDRKH